MSGDEGGGWSGPCRLLLGQQVLFGGGPAQLQLLGQCVGFFLAFLLGAAICSGLSHG